VLTVTLPKSEKAQSQVKRIAIKSWSIQSSRRLPRRPPIRS